MSHLQLIPNGEQVFVDANGEPYALGTVGMYVPNTMTDKDTWQDRDHVALNTNPIDLDAAGRCIIWGEGAYRQILKDHLGNTIWDVLTQVIAIDPADFVSSDAELVTVDDESVTLPNSRQLAAGANITLTDNGAGNTLVISAAASDVTPFQQAFIGGI